MKKYNKAFSAKQTPQTQPAPGEEQIKNHAGGYVYAINDFKRLERFLVLGVEGNTYYQGEKKLILENAECVTRCVDQDPMKVVDLVVEVSDSGRAHRNDQALFVLAIVAGLASTEGKRYALRNLSKVARTGTHLFNFITYVKEFRGWGRMLREAIANWYTEKTVDNMAFQMLKYRNRDGWTHQDVLRLAHVQADSDLRNAMFRWVVGKGDAPVEINPVNVFMKLQKAGSEHAVVSILKETRAPWEFIPNEFLGSREVLKALIPGMPLTALTRQLGKLTHHGALEAMTPELDIVVRNLHSTDYIRKSRLHPLSILVALKTYALGQGQRGKLTWKPIPQVIDALNDAFYLAFGNVKPTGKRTHLAIDVSGSMDAYSVNGLPNFSCREAAAVMALVTASVEPNWEMYGFSTTYTRLNVSPKMRLDDVIHHMRGYRFGGTDCALPMIHCHKKKLERDAFVLYTDNETWAGKVHPMQALQAYRREIVAEAKLAVVGMYSTKISIAKQGDPGSMDFVGFDTATPAAISNFISE